MKNLFILYSISLLLIACHSASPGEEPIHPRSIVTAVTVTIGTMEQTERVPATTVYLQKSQLSSPITGYITEVRVKPGDPVHKGDLL
ncbi:biotin/lipoyl-binding protein [Puia sp. P3]|uniref:biotin/lipoyl-binding protein n=1 Tax=Puia sp. P3 TaxID=3423952 RepID=UPI003D666DD8